MSFAISFALADISLARSLVVFATAVVASIIGGMAGYGTGLLLPLVPGSFTAPRIPARMPVTIQTRMLDAVVILGGVMMAVSALRR